MSYLTASSIELYKLEIKIWRLLLTGNVNLGKLIISLKPLFPHLKSEENNRL